MTAIVIVSVVFAVLFGVAGYLLWRSYRRLQRLEEEIAMLAHDLDQADHEVSQLLAEVGGSRIIVEIINPMSLARTRSRIGGALVGVAPQVIRRRVYDTVASEMKRQLADNDVEAHLQVFHPTGS